MNKKELKKYLAAISLSEMFEADEVFYVRTKLLPVELQEYHQPCSRWYTKVRVSGYYPITIEWSPTPDRTLKTVYCEHGGYVESSDVSAQGIFRLLAHNKKPWWMLW